MTNAAWAEVRSRCKLGSISNSATRVMTSAYTQHLDRTPANFQQLTPLGFLARAAVVFPDYPAIVHGDRTYSYAEFYTRSRPLGSALTKLGIGKNDTVSVMLANMPPCSTRSSACR